MTPTSTSMSRHRWYTSSSRTARSAVVTRYSGDSPAVSSEPSGDGRNDCGIDGLAAASTRNDNGPAPTCGSGTPVRRGCTPCSGSPSNHTRPSAWKPGPFMPQPRSSTASSRSPTQASGTSPPSRNHVVPHGRPHAWPRTNGRYSWPTAASNGTGSPGTSHASIVSGRRCRYRCGSTRCQSSRSIRFSTNTRSSCTDRDYDAVPGRARRTGRARRDER